MKARGVARSVLGGLMGYALARAGLSLWDGAHLQALAFLACAVLALWCMAQIARGRV